MNRVTEADQWLPGEGCKGGITKEPKETLGDNGNVCSLDCGDASMGINMYEYVSNYTF